MPSPYPFLNMGKAAVRNAILRAGREGPRELGSIPPRAIPFRGRQHVPSQEFLGGEAVEDFSARLLDDQIRPAFVEKFGTSPDMQLTTMRFGQELRSLLVIDSPGWKRRTESLGFPFLTGSGGTDYFLIPEDPLLSARKFPFLHE